VNKRVFAFTPGVSELACTYISVQHTSIAWTHWPDTLE